MKPTQEMPGREALLAAALLHRPDPADEPEWWRGAMFYEVYLRSFCDTTGSGVGDLAGVVDKLDYIAALGVDGLWLSPFYPSPMKDFGYDITNFTAVDELYGSFDDVARLIEQAHRRDLRILLDVVPGHTSDEHPWFLESHQNRHNPRADWYIWSDGGTDGGPPNNWLSSFGGSAWQWEPRRAQYYYHPFLKCQPALNLTHPDVLNAVIGNLRFWLDLGIDGFRLDAVQCLCCDMALRSNPRSISDEDNGMVGGGPNNPFKRQLHLFDRDVPEAIGVLERMRDAVSGYEPERVLIGELADMDSSRFSVKYTLRGKRLHAVYDFDLINGAETIDKWVDVLRTRSQYIATGWTMNVLTNHDSVRAVSNLQSDAVEAGRAGEAAKALLFLQATLLGGGIIFQGDELGLVQPELSFEDIRDPWAKAFWPEFAGRDGVRTPLPWKADAPDGGFTGGGNPWLPVAEEHIGHAVDRQDKNPDSVLNFLRELLKWRRRHEVLRLGRETILEQTEPPLIVFDRLLENQRLMIAVNLGLEGAALSLPAEPKLEPMRAGGRCREGALEIKGLGFAAFTMPQSSPLPAGYCSPSFMSGE